MKGFGVKIQPGGTKAFVLAYRVGGRKRLANIARVGEISLKAARERAGADLVRIRDGEADPLERRTERREAPTVADAFERFLGPFSDRRIANGRMTERTRTEYRRQANRYIIPALGSRKVEGIRRADIESMVDGLPATTRNRVLALVSRLCTVCETWEWRPQHSNPARGIERARENARDRVLAGDELAALALALAEADSIHPAAVAAIRVAATTGLRIGEILAIQWDHVDFQTGRLLIPESKTGRRWHDLPTPALEVLAARPRINGNPWAFTNGRGPVGYRHVRSVFASAASAAGLVDARLHDLRRTLMTRAAMAGAGTHVLRDLLGHRSAVMADRYIRAVGNPVREAREAVGGEIGALMSGGNAKVVPLHRRG